MEVNYISKRITIPGHSTRQTKVVQFEEVSNSNADYVKMAIHVAESETASTENNGKRTRMENADNEKDDKLSRLENEGEEKLITIKVK
jgi:hypothetical protein